MSYSNPEHFQPQTSNPTMYQQTPRNIDDFQPRSILLENEEVCAIANRFLTVKESLNFRITTDCVRQIFMPVAMELVKKFSPVELGQICAYCKDLKTAFYYRDSCLVTHGKNAYSAVWFTVNDTGYVMIQKIATAALLAEVIELIGFEPTRDDEKVDPNTLCMPIHVFHDDLEYIQRLQDRLETIRKELEW